MVNLKQRIKLKYVGRILATVLCATIIIVFFQSMKIEPDEYAPCKSPKLECAATETPVPMPTIDTTAIVQIALEDVQEEVKDKFLSKLAGKKLWGIDISKYQSNVNWNLVVKRNKPDFVIVKVTEGTTIVDPMYRSHSQNLEKHDILYGGYHFMSFTSSGRSQALKFIRHAKLGKGNLVPVLDVEYTRRRMPSKRVVQREIRSFCSVIEQHYGVKPIIYTHPHLYTHYLKGQFEDHPLWLCDYKSKPRHEWAIWQHTSKARIYGFRGRVDKNVMKSDRKTLGTLVMF
jgi:lysozyme